MPAGAEEVGAGAALLAYEVVTGIATARPRP